MGQVVGESGLNIEIQLCVKVDRTGSGERILLPGSVSGLGSKRLRGVIWQRWCFL